MSDSTARFMKYDVASKWDYENGFYLTSSVDRIGKLVAHFELYKMILGLPGHVVECGVFKGTSLIRWATFRSLLETVHSRKTGFDSFGDFPIAGDAGDREFISRFEGDAGIGIDVEDLRECMRYKGLDNVDLHKGDISTTVPDYVASHPELRIALLHLYLDVYPPTAVALRHLWHRMVSGGVLVIDDYGTVAGATRAVEEALADEGLQILKLPFAHIPSYVIRR